MEDMEDKEERALYESIKAEILEAIEEIRSELGDKAADELLESIKFDEENMNFMFTGKSRFEFDRIA